MWRNNLAVTQHHTTHLGKTYENTRAKGLEISKLQEKTRRYMTKNTIHSFLYFQNDIIKSELKGCGKERQGLISVLAMGFLF